MESHIDISRNYVKGERVPKEALWADLVKKLNWYGPPTKDLNGWKKTWADYIKNKMFHNKKMQKLMVANTTNMFYQIQRKPWQDWPESTEV